MGEALLKWLDFIGIAQAFGRAISSLSSGMTLAFGPAFKIFIRPGRAARKKAAVGRALP